MLAWYCGQPGHEAALPCLARQLRALPKGPERDALQLKMHEAAEHEASKHESKVNPNRNPNPNSNPNPNPNQVMAQLLFDALRESWHVFEKTG